MLWSWLALAACCASTAVLCLPFPQPLDDEMDGEASRKVLGSSVVTSVSVIMDLGNGTKKYYADAAGNPVPKPTSASMLGSPPELLHPDRYEFYTFNEAGDLVKRLMTLEEIQGIIATGDGDGGELPPNYYHQELPPGLKSPTLLGEGEIGELSSPVDGVHQVIESVQNVLKVEMEAAKNKPSSGPTTTTTATTRPSSTSAETSTASASTTYRPSTRYPVRRPTTQAASSTTRTTDMSTTSRLPSSTTRTPPKMSSRRPSIPSSTTTGMPQKSTSYSTTTRSTTPSSSPTTTDVFGKEEATSKIPIAIDNVVNTIDNEVSYASASNINAEIINSTSFNASENTSSTSPPTKFSTKDELVSKTATPSSTTMVGEITGNPTEKYQNAGSFMDKDNEYSEDSSVTSIQNIKPSVTVIANSTINAIYGPSSMGKPGYQPVSNNDNKNAGGQNSTTSIQNVEPVVTIILNSTVNSASGTPTIMNKISEHPKVGTPGGPVPSESNLHANPALIVTERIEHEEASQDHTTGDSSSEDESSENLNSIESLSTELPKNIISTLLHMMGADLTTQSSEEYDSSESESNVFDENTDKNPVNSVNETDMLVKTSGSTTDSDETAVASPSEVSSTNSTKIAEDHKTKPLKNDSLIMEGNQSISSIVGMLMDGNPTFNATKPSVLSQNSLDSNKISVPSKEGTIIVPTVHLVPTNETTQNNGLSDTISNKTVDILNPASPESGNVVLYSNNLLPPVEKSEMKLSPPKPSITYVEENSNHTTHFSNNSISSSSTNKPTSAVDIAMENTTKIFDANANDSTTYGSTDAHSETNVVKEESTETLKTAAETSKNKVATKVNSTYTKPGNINNSRNDSKITAPSEIVELVEKQTISPDSYLVIPGGGPVEEVDLVAPEQQSWDNSSSSYGQVANKESSMNDNNSMTPALMANKSAVNELELENAASTNIKSSAIENNIVTEFDDNDKYITIPPFTDAATTTKKLANVPDNEKIQSTPAMPTAATKTPSLATSSLPTDISGADSDFISLKISPQLEESVSNVLSQVSDKTATTILAAEEEMIADITTQMTTTDIDDLTKMPVISSTRPNQADKSSGQKLQMKTPKENVTEEMDNGSIETIPQDSIISQVSVQLAGTNSKIFNKDTILQEMPMETEVLKESEASKLMNETDSTEVIKEDTKEIETKVDLKNRGNVSDEILDVIPGKESNKIKTQNSSTVSQAAISAVDEYTNSSETWNENVRVPAEDKEIVGATTMPEETATRKLVTPAEEISTMSPADTSTDTTDAITQMPKNKPQGTVGVPEMAEETTLQMTDMITEHSMTDKLPLASQIKGTQVKLIDSEEEQLLKVDTVTVASRETTAANNDSHVASAGLPTATWQKIYDSSEKMTNKSTTSKLDEESSVTDSIKEMNFVDDNAGDVTNTTGPSDASDTKTAEEAQRIESILKVDNSIVNVDKFVKTTSFSANKNTSKIVIVPGITQAIFHMDENDLIETTEQPTTTTTDASSLVGETILPSKYVEQVAKDGAAGAEETNMELTENNSGDGAGTEADLDNEVNSTEKTWSLVSTVVPPQTKITTSRTADQTTKPATSVDTAKQDQLDLHPAPVESLGLESTTFGLDRDVSDFVELCNELALKLWQPVANKRATVSRSLVMSPFAVTSLLAMVFLGARGGTSGQMNDILRLDDVVTFNPHQVFRNVTESMVMTKNPGIATVAFVRELYSDKAKGRLLDFYKERAQQFYEGHVEEVNFDMVGDVVRRRTNLLVKRQTYGKVPEYIRGSNIMLRPPLSVFSANIFQTDCSEASTSGRDGEMYFTVIPASRQRRLVPVPAVVWRSGFLAGYDPMLDATAVSVGDASSLVSLVMVLPGQQGNTAPGDSVAALEDRLWNSPGSQEAWSRLLRSLLARPGLELQLPRFSHRSMLNMTGTLQRMGLQDLFSEGRADLKGLNGLANDLHLSDIVQVNTFGTCGELAPDARRHVEIFPGSSSQRAGRRRPAGAEGNQLPDLSGIPLALRPRQARVPDSPRLRYDRPFLYVVRHNPTGLILHMGRFNPRVVRS